METKPFHRQIVWYMVLILVTVHVLGFYGLYQFIRAPYWGTFLWFYLMQVGSTHGSVAGVHRLWSHRAFKAKLPFRIYLAFFQTLSYQGSIYHWARDHRNHHKFADTTADPHNINEGFLYAHMGWLVMKKHPDVIEKGKLNDLSDLEQDPVVMFQKKYYNVLGPICSFLIPALVPWYFWNESFWIGINFCGAFRHVITSHCTALINSYAHTFGTRPYDKQQQATETSLVAHLTNGDGWHNYHHTFPWDYRAGEFDSYSGNMCLALIDFMAKIGQAYDLKKASPELIEKQAAKRGDQSRPSNKKYCTEQEYVHR